MVSPKVQENLELEKEIRSRCDKRETDFKNKTLKNAAKFSINRNFEKPVTAKTFQKQPAVGESYKINVH